MSKIETFQLCHPELLSEVTLREILQNSCIVLPIFENLSKDELIEIFKRIAMPMPQRKYDETRNLGKKLNELRAKKGIEVATFDENTDILLKSDCLVPNSDSGLKNRLKPPVDDAQQISKKIRLSNSCHHNSVAEDMKRKIEQISSISESKKRQKITWP